MCIRLFLMILIISYFRTEVTMLLVQSRLKVEIYIILAILLNVTRIIKKQKLSETLCKILLFTIK